MANNIFKIALFGFSNLERTLIDGVCKLSQARLQRVLSQGQSGFQTIKPDDADTADILLVDGDDTDTLQSGIIAHKLYPDAPLIVVSKHPQAPSQPGEFVLARPRLGGLLLKLLDQIVAQWINDDSERPSRLTIKHKKSCLVVDDSQLVRTQMEMILSKYPLAIVFAEDAETALKLAVEQSFDIIFLDVMLPEMNGYKACKLLKMHPKTSTTPVVMLTSKKSPFNKMHGALVGCDKYLTKPIDAKKVHQAIEQYEVVDNVEEFRQLSRPAW